MALQALFTLCSGIRETTGTHPFGLEMNALLMELTRETDSSLKDALARRTIAELADRI